MRQFLLEAWSRFFDRLAAWHKSVTLTHVVSRPMTADELADFNAAFKKMDEAFDAMDAAFRKVK